MVVSGVVPHEISKSVASRMFLGIPAVFSILPEIIGVTCFCLGRKRGGKHMRKEGRELFGNKEKSSKKYRLKTRKKCAKRAIFWYDGPFVISSSNSCS